MLKHYERGLSESEGRWIQKDVRSGRTRIRRYLWFSLISSIVVCLAGVPLALWQATKDPNLGYLAFGTMGIYTVIIWWVYWKNGGETKRHLRSLKRALEVNRVHVTHCQSSEMVEAEELEDEGAEYFFQVESGKILCLCGQQYYATRRFPNADFELVEIWTDDHPVSWTIVCHGAKLTPTRTISKADKERLLRSEGYPKDMEVIDGRLDQLEEIILRGER